ncbi:hypothetical protein DOTSEDRAFT_49448 [Dothistroma septosporum NZE10]|uniref:PHD-type domain-containing protein n=1 Tax=Dothistroma septosporum (strain NZE10 / CBS 128990) TaxID=675120 RepID=N1Q1K8_DOTSN|nr:hypothetical protein DOTSEDRAFT_49448 [Dothistroma septosporum NZE10]
MPRYKRTAVDAQLDVFTEPAMPPEQQETLTRLRSMWEFASLMQYIFLFGHVVKVDDDFDMEDLEAECLLPEPSEKLARIGLQLLKYVSSHRGLTPDIFDEYTRRQYIAKAPHRNPFGDDEDPVKFNDLDVYTRIQVLQQLSTWTLGNADRIRGMMPQDEDHLGWRMEPLGWDRDDRAYYVLDDNRLYRRADEPLPPPKPKPKAKPKPMSKSKVSKAAKSRGTRASKRRKVEETEDEETEEQQEADDTAVEDTIMMKGDAADQGEEPGYGFTSKTWECIAITLEEFQEFMSTIFRSRDPNEKQLYKRIETDVLPIIEKRAEALRQKELKKLREIENVQKMATAKRSSRLAGKAEKEAQERADREAEEKRRAELSMAREEQERQKRIEEGHESRRLTREQRVREREAKRILHEEELAKLEEEGDRAESQEVDSEAGDAKRVSERQRKTQKEQHKKELEALAEDEGTWYFDCAVCGKHGENMDDGSHSIACDRCSVWQHSKCHGFSPKQAEAEGFTFVCRTCTRKEEDAKKPRLPPLKLHNRNSGSPEAHKSDSRPATANAQLPDHVARQLDGMHTQQSRPSPGHFGQITNGSSLVPQSHPQAPDGYRYPPVGNFAPHPQAQTWQGSSNVPPTGRVPGYGPTSPPILNRYPAHHQQQHQYAHRNAVATAGGHPAYHQTQYTQPPYANDHHGQAPAGMHTTATPVHGQHFQQPPAQSVDHYSQQMHRQQIHHPQQQRRQGSAQLMNGFQSPAKLAGGPAFSSPPDQRPPSPKYSPQQSQQHLQQSPRTNLPPPKETYQQRPAQSPVKSSPPPMHQSGPSPRPSQLTQTPQNLPAPGHGALHGSSHLQTPHQMTRPGSGHAGAANATNVAADGMSGPWPDGSKAIPLKHDQSPAPPASAQSIDNTKIFPPTTPLVPSPSQQAAGATGSVPVKKMPALSSEAKPAANGLPPLALQRPEIGLQNRSQAFAQAPMLPGADSPSSERP